MRRKFVTTPEEEMEDTQIVEMYWERNESAIAETQTKYGTYLRRVAYNILANDEDCGECVNDTYFKAWESIPPNRPAKLSAYLAAITRNLAISLFRSKNTASRAGSQYALSLDELSECVSGDDTVEGAAESGMISKSISNYLRTLPQEARVIFVCRYFYNDSITDIAGYFGASESKIKSSLFRTRKGLKEHLTKDGIDI